MFKSSHVTIMFCLFIVIFFYIDLNLYWKEKISVKIPQILKNQMSWISEQKMCQILPKGLKGHIGEKYGSQFDLARLRLIEYFSCFLLIDINLNQQILQWAQIEVENSDNSKGGLHHPSNCTARHKVAILIPYR